MSKPTESVMQVALQVTKYLNQTCDKVLRLGGEGQAQLVITAYTDANWASDPNTNQWSTSGSVVKVFGSLVTWNSHIQKCVSNLAMEAKYVASLAVACEALFHQHLLQGLGFGDHTPVILTDNTGCIQVAKDQALDSKLKHINMKYHLIQHHILEGNIAMRYI